MDGEWLQPIAIASHKFQCGYCDSIVASVKGWFCVTKQGSRTGEVLICPHCNFPTFFDGEKHYPSAAPGESVKHVPQNVNGLYEEARASTGAGAPTAAVLALRKLLMNIAVDKGAPPGISFQKYVDYLAQMHYVPPNGNEWVDTIRNKGNEATHEIVIMSQSDAEELINFAEMLLKFIYEFPIKARPHVNRI